MEDDKLAAYYDDLTRRGSGAARFKQGLGFSSNSSSTNDDVPSRGSALPTAPSFLSSFVKASSPSKTSEFEKQAELQSIQNKLSIKPKARSRSPSRDKIRDSRDRIRDKHSRRRSSSRDGHSRRRSRSRSRDRQSWHRHRSRSRSREKNRQRSKRQESPEERRSDKGKRREVVRGGGIDFAKLIDGYDSMTPAERVKAKMKLQLSKTAENDETIGNGSGWERFEFNKDAPLDDEEIEAAEDDVGLVKNMGQSFRFTAVVARKEEEMKALHDEAMFGVSSHPPAGAETDEEEEGAKHGKESVETDPATSLLSKQVLSMKQGSWRDRACKR